MPQYVWAQHHNYHHAHNGNWERYRGPYATLSVDEYAALTTAQQRFYRYKCSVPAAPLAGLHLPDRESAPDLDQGHVRAVGTYSPAAKFARSGLSVRELSASYRTRYWKTPKEYHHMLWNNLVLLSAWAIMCWYFGAGLFFIIYLLTVSIAGGLGIVLFTVQHNFEHSYATGCATLGLRYGRHRRHQFPGAARLAELLHRQHRLSPYSPSVLEHPQLPPGAVPQRVSAPVSECRRA